MRRKLLLAFLLMMCCSAPYYSKIAFADTTPEANPNPIVYPKPKAYPGRWYDFSWSPSNEEIAVVGDASTEPGYGGSLLVMNANGSDIREIAANKGWRMPSWTPDGSRIVALAYGVWPSPIYIMNADGSNSTPIGEDAISCDLSSDGSRLAFGRFENEGLWTMDINGFDLQMIASSNDSVFEGRWAGFYYVDWAQGNSKILACVDEFSGGRYGTFQRRSVLVMNSDGSNLTKVYSVELSPWSWPPTVHWSPDGNKILYSFGVENPGIWIMNTDGSNRTLIIEDGSSPAWSSDASKIAFYYADMGLYMLDLQKPSVLPPDTDKDGMPDGWEYRNSLNPFNASDTQQDSDRDGLASLEEFNYRTNITNSDTDGDGLSDGLEVHVFKTDPTKKDTDNDGISDGLEAAAAGFSADLTVLPENCMAIRLHWLNYSMNIYTNSSVIGVTFNSTAKELTVNVGGTEGTTGFCNLTVPKPIVTSNSSISIYLDNQPMNFVLSEDSLYYYIGVHYEHSWHELSAHLSTSGNSYFDYVPYATGGAIAAILGAVFVAVRRKRRQQNSTA